MRCTTSVREGMRAATILGDGFLSLWPRARAWKRSAAAIRRLNAPASQTADHRAADRNPDEAVILPALSNRKERAATVPKSEWQPLPDQSALQSERAPPRNTGGNWG